MKVECVNCYGALHLNQTKSAQICVCIACYLLGIYGAVDVYLNGLYDLNVWDSLAVCLTAFGLSKTLDLCAKGSA